MSRQDEIVKILVSRNTRSASVKDFGTILFLSTTAAVRVKQYGSPDEVAADFTTDSVEYRASNAVFGQNPAPEKFKIGQVDGAETILQALMAVSDVDPEWYIPTYEAQLPAAEDLTALAGYLRTNKKFAVWGSAEANIPGEDKATDVTSLSYLCNQAKMDKGTVFYHSLFRTAVAADQSKGFADMDFAAMLAVRPPGSYTANFQELLSTPADTFSSAGYTNIFDKNSQLIQKIAGLQLTEEGRVCDGNDKGEWIDTMIGIDWLEASIQQVLITLLANQEKIPYTNKGTAQLEGEVMGVGDLAVSRDFLAEYLTKTKDVAESTDADKAARTYRGLTLDGKLAGAIHKAEISVAIFY